MRHNEVRDITAMLLTEICHGVTTEPHLQPLSGESLSHRSAITEDGARLDVAMYGFWGGRFEKAFVDQWRIQDFYKGGSRYMNARAARAKI